MMNVYEELGVTTVVNLAGAMTRYGGALLKPRVLEAMNQAAESSVRIDQLQAMASHRIARMTHAEAGVVTCGAGAALTLATAACIARFDIAVMNRLPDAEGIPNEVVMPWHQVSGYDHSISVAGARIVGAGIPNDTSEPREVYVTDRWDIEAAICHKTAALAYAARPGAHPPLAEIVSVAHAHDLPVIVDAADQVPPVSNLHAYVDLGADLVCISGGKGIRGPQASGILCGRRDLVGSALLQMLDVAGESFPDWEPPESLIPKSKLRAKPQHGIGRGMKVTKESIVGLLAALEDFTEEGFKKEAAEKRLMLDGMASSLADMPGVELDIVDDGGYPRLEIVVDGGVVGRTAHEIVKALGAGTPPILVEDSRLDAGVICLDSLNLSTEIVPFVGDSLRTVLSAN